MLLKLWNDKLCLTVVALRFSSVVASSLASTQAVVGPVAGHGEYAISLRETLHAIQPLNLVSLSDVCVEWYLKLKMILELTFQFLDLPC